MTVAIVNLLETIKVNVDEAEDACLCASDIDQVSSPFSSENRLWMSVSKSNSER